MTGYAANGCGMGFDRSEAAAVGDFPEPNHGAVAGANGENLRGQNLLHIWKSVRNRVFIHPLRLNLETTRR